MKRLVPALVLAAALLPGAGCVSGPYASMGEARPGVPEAQATVVLMDEPVQVSVTSVGDRGELLPDGRLRATARLKNREGRRLQVQVQGVFKDEQGFSTGDESPWQTLILTEYATEAVSFDSINTRARTYVIRVREAR